MFADIAATQPIRVLSLRYFNPIGADPKMRTGLQLPKPTHAVGKMMQSLERVPVQVTGTDYPTGRIGYPGLHPCLGPRHRSRRGAQQIRYPLPPGTTSTVINLGTGTGTTVRELLDAFNGVVSAPIKAEDAARRPGDIAGAYTRIDRARQMLDWQPRYGVPEGIRHSLQWASIRGHVLSYRSLNRNVLWPAAADLISAAVKSDGVSLPVGTIRT